MKGGKTGCWLLNPLEVTSARTGGLQQCGEEQQQWPLLLCLCLLEEAVGDQRTDPGCLENKALFAYPGFIRLFQECCTAACQALRDRQLKLIESNHILSSKPSPGNCKPLLDSRVPKYLHQTGSASAVVVQVGRWIPGASYSLSSQNPLCLMCF